MPLHWSHVPEGILNAMLIEKAIDKCRDVGNIVYSIVLKNS